MLVPANETRETKYLAEVEKLRASGDVGNGVTKSTGCVRELKEQGINTHKPKDPQTGS